MIILRAKLRAAEEAVEALAETTTPATAGFEPALLAVRGCRQINTPEAMAMHGIAEAIRLLIRTLLALQPISGPRAYAARLQIQMVIVELEAMDDRPRLQ